MNRCVNHYQLADLCRSVTSDSDMYEEMIAAYEILQARVDDSKENGCIRILTNNLIKYILVDPGTFTSYRTRSPPRSKLKAELPAIPPGDWTTINLSRDPKDGALSFYGAKNGPLPGVERMWHPVQIDYFNLIFTRSFTYNVYEATIPAHLAVGLGPILPSVMIAKFARYPDEVDCYSRENEIYAKIKDLNIAPKFLGYITENNRSRCRPIGYLLEKLEGRHATSLADFPLCRSLLETFQRATGYMHGDPNCNNFIIKLDGLSTMIFDFERAQERDQDTLTWEIEMFEENMREDEESKQEIGEAKWRENCLREQLEVVAPMSEEDELRMDELGEDEWVAEKVRQQLREEQLAGQEDQEDRET